MTGSRRVIATRPGFDGYFAAAKRRVRAMDFRFVKIEGAGPLAKAAIAAAQAGLAKRGEWALGEAGIVRRTALGGSETILAATGDRPLDLERAVTRMRVALGLTASGTG